MPSREEGRAAPVFANYVYDVFVICSRSDNESACLELDDYLARLAREGKRVFCKRKNDYPADGYLISQESAIALRRSREVHLYYQPQSALIPFCLGVAYALGKSLVIVNPEAVKKEASKWLSEFVFRWAQMK